MHSVAETNTTLAPNPAAGAFELGSHLFTWLLAIGMSTSCSARGADASYSPQSQLQTPCQDVYVWQRAWTEPVRSAVVHSTADFREVAVLAAEVSWKSYEPKLIRPAIHFDTLKQSGRPIGLAFRIGPFPGPFASDDHRARWLSKLAVSLVAEAKSHGVTPVELQIDFDCAESKLDGYRLWVSAIRKAIAPTPLSITALPAWLAQPAFARLIRETDDYVLQVHSLERPRDVHAAFTLCDPASAIRWVNQAGKHAVPFRVALPTYGYLVAFDGGGKFVGLSAEGPALDWPADVQLREVMANPAQIAPLVAAWNHSRPLSMKGIIWYRLPVEGEQRNWPTQTLAEVMRGIIPKAMLSLTTETPRPNLFEFSLRNQGTARHASPVDVVLRWKSGRIIASDALAGFKAVDGSANTIHFRSSKSMLEPGRTRKLGWVRFEGAQGVSVELVSADE